MEFLLLLFLMIPPIAYFVFAYGVFHFAIDFLFFLGIIGAFLIGGGVYKKIISKVWKLPSKTPTLLAVSGIMTIGLSLILRKSGIQIDEVASLEVFLRIVLLSVLVISYFDFQALLKRKARLILNLVMGSCFVTLATIAIAVYWSEPLHKGYSYTFLIIAICISVLNVFSTVSKNLYFHKSPFVFFQKIEGRNKYTDIFTDILGIICPIICAIAQII